MAADNDRRFRKFSDAFFAFGLCMKLLSDSDARNNMTVLVGEASWTLSEPLFALLTQTLDTLAAASDKIGIKAFHGSDAITPNVIMEVAVMQARTISYDMHPLVIANERVTGTSVFEMFLRLGMALIEGNDPPSVLYLSGAYDKPTLISFPASSLSEMLTLTEWECDRCDKVNDGPMCTECDAVCEDCGNRNHSCFCIR